MPPQQPPLNPYPAPQPQGPQAPYDFIMNPTPPKRPVPFKGNPKALLFVIGVVAAVIVLLIVIFSALTGGGKNSEVFIGVAQQQQEMQRVVDLQYSALKTEDAKYFAENTKLTMATDEAQLTSLLAKNGIKTNAKQLALGANATTDAKLTQAASTGNLDTAVVAELQQELTRYKASVQQAYTVTTSPTAKNLLKQQYDHAVLLLAQSKQ